MFFLTLYLDRGFLSRDLVFKMMCSSLAASVLENI